MRAALRWLSLHWSRPLESLIVVALLRGWLDDDAPDDWRDGLLSWSWRRRDRRIACEAGGWATWHGIEGDD